MTPVAYADFGPLVASVDIDAAVLTTIELWMDTYLGQLETERGKTAGFYARPKAYDSVIEETEFLDHALPAVLAATAKVNGTPEIMADGSYSTPWLVAVSTVVRGRRAIEAKTLGSLFEATVRRLLVQQSSLGGFASGVRWIAGGEVRPLSDQSGQGRYLAEGASQYLVFVDDNVREGTGPITPEAAPYHALAEVESVPLTVTGSSPGGS